MSTKKPTRLSVLVDSEGHGTCRSCHADITWYELTSGRKHPVNRGAPILQTKHDDNGQLVGTIDSSDSHFATCPQARDWSRR